MQNTHNSHLVVHLWGEKWGVLQIQILGLEFVISKFTNVMHHFIYLENLILIEWNFATVYCISHQ